VAAVAAVAYALKTPVVALLHTEGMAALAVLVLS
jgi:hypothetical protein